MKFIKRMMLSVLALVLAISTMSGSLIAKDLSDDKYIPYNNINGLNVKFIARYYGDENTGIRGDATSKNCNDRTDLSVLFDGNTSTGIYLRDASDSWDGHINTGDYLGAEFEQPINFRGVTFTLDNEGDVNDSYRKASIQYRLDGSEEWVTVKDFTGKMSSAAYSGELISNVKAVRLLNTHTSNETQVWVMVKEIAIDGSIPGEGNYTLVHAAIQKANAIVKEDYDPATVTALENKIAAVEEGLTDNEQDVIDGYAQAINDAYDSLIKIRHEQSVNNIEIVKVGEQRTGQEVSKIFDGDTSTLWHTNWNGSDRSTHYFVLKVPANYYEKLVLTPRSNGSVNGIITKMNVYARLDENITFDADYNWREDSSWTKIVDCATNTSGLTTVTIDEERNIKANYLLIEVVEAKSDNSLVFASLAELDLFYKSNQLNRSKWKVAAFFQYLDEGVEEDNAEYGDNAVDYEKNPEITSSEGPAEYMFDGNTGTIFHTDWAHQSANYYKNSPIEMIIKFDKVNTFNYVDWTNRLDKTTCRLGMFELYTIDGDQEYSDEELRSGAPWAKKFSITADNKANNKFYVGEQSAKYVKIICKSREATGHVTCSELNFYHSQPEELGDVKYSGFNSELELSSDWVRESAYDQYGNVNGYFGKIEENTNVFSNAAANLVKYVTSNVLSVKAQSTITSDDKCNVRFITSIASTNLEELRFKVEVVYADGTVRTAYKSTKRVFETILADDVEMSDAADVFDNTVSTHFALIKLNNITREAVQTGTKIVVTPYWAPKDVQIGDYENYVEGVAREFTAQELFDKAN